jgi:predicted oxidoreductase
MDGELQELFNYAISKGVNLFDTADSYGEPPSKVTAKTSDKLKRLAKSLERCDPERCCGCRNWPPEWPQRAATR